MVFALPLALLVLVPSWVFTLGEMRGAQAEALLAGGLVLVAWETGNKWLRAWAVYLAAWAFYLQLTAIAHPDAWVMIVRREMWPSLGWILCGLMLYGAVRRMGAGRSIKPLAWVALGAMALQLAVMVFQATGNDPVMGALSLLSDKYVKRTDWAAGTLGNPNFITIWLAMLLPLARLWLKPPVFALATLATCALAAGMHTTTAVAAALAGWLTLALFHDRRLLWIPLAALPVGAAWFLAFDGGGWELAGMVRKGGEGARVATWGLTIKTWWEGSPWFGFGLGCWPAWWAAGKPEDAYWVWRAAHNEYIQHVFECGGFGMLLVLGWLADLFRRAWGRRADLDVSVLAAMVASAAVACLGAYVLHLAALGAVMVLGAAWLDGRAHG